MGELEIYDTQARRVDPPTNEAVVAEGEVSEFVHAPIDFYFDPDRRWVVAYVRAESSVVSGDRYAHYHASYVASEGEDPLAGLLNRLRSLQNRRDDATGADADGTLPKWKFIDDRERFYLPWLIERVTNPSLDDTGLDSLERWTVRRLLEDGQRLSFGVDSRRMAANTIAYFHHELDASLSMSVSAGGRIDAVRDVDLVLMPGDFDGMTPLSDGTREKVMNRSADTAEEIRKQYEARATAAIDAIVGSEDLSAIERYRELAGVERYVSSLWSGETEHTNLRSESAERVVQIATALHRGNSAEDLPDAGKFLDEAGRTAARDTILDRLASERETLKSAMPKQVRAEFKTALKDLLGHEVGSVKESLERLIELFEGDRAELPSSLPEPASRIAERKAELEEQEVLDPDERDRIRKEFAEEFTETLDTLKQRKRENLLDQFEERLADLDLTDIRQEDRVVSQLRRVVDRHQDADVDSETVARFQSVVDEVETSPIFSTGERVSLHNDLEDLLEDRLKTLREMRESSLRNRLERNVALLEQRSAGEDLVDVYDRLSRARKLCSSAPSQHVDHTGLQRFADLVRELNQDEFVPQRRAAEIRNAIDEQIGEELDRIKKTRREEIRDKFADELDRAVVQVIEVDEDGRKRAVAQLGKLRGYVDGESDRPRDPRFEEVCDLIDHIGRTPPGNSLVILDREHRIKLRTAIRETIDEHRTGIREEQKCRIANQFNGLVEDVLEHPGLSLRVRIKLLDSVVEHLDRPGGHGPRSLSELEVDVPSRQRPDVETLYRRVTDHIERSRSPRVETILTRDQRRELRKEHFKDTLEDALATAREEFKNEIIKRIKQEIESGLTPVNGSENTDLDALDGDIELLEAVKSRLNSTRSPQEEGIPDHIAEAIVEINSSQLLPSDDREELCEKITSFVDDLLADRREVRRQQQLDSFEDEIDQIVGSRSLDAGEKLRALRQLEVLLSKGSLEGHQYLSDPQSLMATRESLDSEGISKLLARNNEVREGLAAQYANQVVENVREQLEAYVNNISDDSAKIALESFDKYLSGSSFEPNPRPLIRSKNWVDEAAQLYDIDALPQNHHEDIKTAIHETIEDLKPDQGGRLVHRERRVRNTRRNNRLRDAPGWAIDKVTRDYRLAMLIGLVVGLLLGGAIVYGVLPWAGISVPET